jgi:steroid Delta-isomerase
VTELPPLLGRHVAAFNGGVRTGDFDPMVEGFTDDAVMVFERVPVGPFVGRAAIADAYREQPPDDEIDVLDVRERDGVIEALYGWRRDGGAAAGRMLLTPAGDLIEGLVVTFEPGAILD